MYKLIAVTFLMAALESAAFAGTIVRVPEVDASTGVAAVTLLAGGLLILKTRRKRSSK